MDITLIDAHINFLAPNWPTITLHGETPTETFTLAAPFPSFAYLVEDVRNKQHTTWGKAWTLVAEKYLGSELETESFRVDWVDKHPEATSGDRPYRLVPPYIKSRLLAPPPVGYGDTDYHLVSSRTQPPPEASDVADDE